jgi:glycosyltransferase involved in cell wall biosynthesis
VEKKGFDILIDACAILRDRGIEFSCDLIGGGPLEDVLKRLANDRGVDQQVRILGPRSQDEVRRELASAQVFALACQQDAEGGSDNLPTVIAEAMFAGLPCISTTIAGVPEMIEDGVNGMLVPPRNAAALADRMERLISDRGTRGPFGTSGFDDREGEVFHRAVGARTLATSRKKAKVPDPSRPHRWWSW